MADSYCPPGGWNIYVPKQARKLVQAVFDTDALDATLVVACASRDDVLSAMRWLAYTGDVDAMRVMQDRYAITKEEAHKIKLLGRAICGGEIASVRFVQATFEFTADQVRARDNRLLIHCAAEGKVDILCFLRGMGLGPDDARAKNNSALMKAAKFGKLSSILCLFHVFELREADVATDGYCALRLAAEGGHADVVAHFGTTYGVMFKSLRRGFSDAFVMAVTNGHAPVVAELSKLIERALVYYECGRMNFAICWACRHGDLAVLKALIEHFCVLNFSDPPPFAYAHDNYPLRKAAKHGHVDIVQYLHDVMKLNVVDARACNNYALRKAAQNGHNSVLNYLRIHFGLGLKDARAKGNYALKAAARNGHSDVVKTLTTQFGLRLFDV